MTGKKKLFAIIAVAYNGERTFYVKRSQRMANYPGVWSLPSIQFDPSELSDPSDLAAVARYMDVMSEQRLGEARLRIEELLTSGSSDANPIDRDVHLYLYRIAFETAPVLNPDFYNDSRWMTAAEFEEATVDQTCGLCVRLWADYAWMLGVSDHPYVHRQVSHAR